MESFNFILNPTHMLYLWASAWLGVDETGQWLVEISGHLFAGFCPLDVVAGNRTITADSCFLLFCFWGVGDSQLQSTDKLTSSLDT